MHFSQPHIFLISVDSWINFKTTHKMLNKLAHYSFYSGLAKLATLSFCNFLSFFNSSCIFDHNSAKSPLTAKMKKLLESSDSGLSHCMLLHFVSCQDPEIWPCKLSEPHFLDTDFFYFLPFYFSAFRWRAKPQYTHESPDSGLHPGMFPISERCI